MGGAHSLHVAHPANLSKYYTILKKKKKTLRVILAYFKYCSYNKHFIIFSVFPHDTPVVFWGTYRTVIDSGFFLSAAPYATPAVLWDGSRIVIAFLSATPRDAHEVL